MKNRFIIEKKNIEKIINYDEIKKKNFFLNVNLKKIFKDLLDFDEELKIEKGENNDNIVYQKDKPLCSFIIDDDCMLYKYIIKIAKDNILYEYDIIENPKSLIGSLKSASFIKNGINYSMERYYSKYFIDIKSNNKGIYLVLENSTDEERDIPKLIAEINLDDKIEKIYDKLSPMFNTYNNLTIKKYNILNTIDMKEINTDLIIIEKGRLIDYLATIEKQEKKYIIKKERDNYSITLLNSSIDGLLSTCFDIDRQVKFVKKLEKKK